MGFQHNRQLASEAGQKSKATKHKKTKQWEAIGEKMLGEWSDEVIGLYSKLPPKEKIDLFLSLLEYFKPKLNRTEGSYKIDGLEDKIGSVYAALQQQPPLPK